MSLSEAAVRNAKPASRAVKLFDSGGLYLLVSPTGGKWWRFDYRFAGKRKTLSMGVYPDVGLKAARTRRDDARKLLAGQTDPGRVRKTMRRARHEAATNSFEAIAREWFSKQEPAWAPGHADKVIQRFERDVFPWLGSQPVTDITAPELLAVLRRIESRGAVDTAHRALQTSGQVFRYAIATGRAERDPSGDLRGALGPVRQHHYASITDPKEIGALLRNLDEYEGTFVTKCALRLSPLVFVRPGELRHAEWTEIDLNKAEWRIPAHKMKMRRPHVVPLSKQAVEILRDLHPLTGPKGYVFPSVSSAT
ncbi:MAG TPA: integrase arm-type DNA-binding domain-containing protein, partial [bacterium]|nr:integrase arm-type DNA-binding domain-containing protein [bacterium]